MRSSGKGSSGTNSVEEIGIFLQFEMIGAYFVQEWFTARKPNLVGFYKPRANQIVVYLVYNTQFLLEVFTERRPKYN